VICVADPAEAEARDRRMLGQAREQKAPIDAPLPPLGTGCFAEGAPAAGQLFVQDLVRHRGVTGRFDDVIGRGFALVSPAGDPAAALEPEPAAWFAALGGISAHVAPGARVEDLNGGYARWFEKHGVGVALARPDFAVFGAARELAGANDLVRALRARVEGGPR
jgi:3-(3-hydroxy-phenyl)propionate hydroxylase